MRPVAKSTLRRLEIVDETANENAELTTKVKNMHAELDVWKRAVVASRDSTVKQSPVTNSSHPVDEGVSV
jgi:hypothetical protein